jgi:NTE family protein
MTTQYTHIVLSGGGMSGLVYLGVLRYLQQEGYDKNIRHIAGASIGALFATAFAIGMSMGDLEKNFKIFFADYEKCKIPVSMASLIQSYDNLGIDDGKRLIEPIQDVIGNLTFLELSKRTGKDLVISATHLYSMEPTYFSVNLTPHVRVIDAVRASMAVPIFIKPVEIGDDYYIDGGISDGVPINAFPNVNPDSVLILHLTRQSKRIEEHHTISPLRIILSMLQSYLRNYLAQKLLESKYPHYCPFNSCPVGFVPLVWENDECILKILPEKIDQSFEKGYEQIQEFLKLREKSKDL